MVAAEGGVRWGGGSLVRSWLCSNGFENALGENKMMCLCRWRLVYADAVLVVGLRGFVCMFAGRGGERGELRRKPQETIRFPDHKKIWSTGGLMGFPRVRGGAGFRNQSERPICQSGGTA